MDFWLETIDATIVRHATPRPSPSTSTYDDDKTFFSFAVTVASIALGIFARSLLVVALVYFDDEQ